MLLLLLRPVRRQLRAPPERGGGAVAAGGGGGGGGQRGGRRGHPGRQPGNVKKEFLHIFNKTKFSMISPGGERFKEHPVLRLLHR